MGCGRLCNPKTIPLGGRGMANGEGVSQIPSCCIALWSLWGPGCLGSNPSRVTNRLSDLGQAPQPLCLSSLPENSVLMTQMPGAV